MAKFIKKFSGVKNGDIYPTEFKVGQKCPKELIAGAEAEGALGDAEAVKAAIAAAAAEDAGDDASDGGGGDGDEAES